MKMEASLARENNELQNGLVMQEHDTACKISLEEQKVDSEKVPNRQTEDGVVESDLKDLNVKGLDAKLAMLESDYGLDHEAVPESTEMNSEGRDMKQLESPSGATDSADNNHRRSGGKNSGTSKKSTKRKSSLGSISASTRVLRSRSQEKSDAPQTTETGTVQISCPDPEQTGLPNEDLTEKIGFEQPRTAAEDEKNITPELGGPTEEAALCKSLDSPQTPHNSSARQQESQPEEAANSTKNSGGRGKKGSKTSAKGKKELTTSAENARVLRSRSQEKSKAIEPSNNAEVHTGSNGEQRRKRKKKKQQNKNPVDEYLRIRKHLKYLLHRMAYEQNLIDAYSGEGWKGQSLEKLKPEKELERAKSEILKCKLRIRNLFQRLDSLIEEGRFPETLYDSDGLLDSEDIYCAKCGSKDLLEDNDIILCDGACERGFHQFCLEPPLLKEQIPSDEEGWLCPGCDCKVDCIDLLNDAQGTNLSILKTWEKVFPEAAAAAAGNKLDENSGLPSDDSDDDDYDPDCSDADDKVLEDESASDESTSDESDLYSASEELNPVKSEHNLQLSSDDSEDEDFDPDAKDLDEDEQVKQESSSSDFSSDSEDFSVAFDDSKKDEHISVSSDQDHMGTGKLVGGGTAKLGMQKKQSIDKVLSLSKPDPDVSESAPVSEKRHVERLDYKKLYENEYGNDATDSSDEEWFDAEDAPRKRMKNNAKEVASGSCDPSTQVREEADDNSVKKHEQETGTKTPKKKARKKAGTEGMHSSPAKGSSEPSSSNKKSQSKRLGDTATQGLLMAFKENQYPDKTKKETLAKELGITLAQVSKWFENARWSFRHTSRMNASLAQCSPTKVTPTKPGSQDVKANGASIGEQTQTNDGASMNESLSGESSKKKPSTLSSRKRRSQGGGEQATDHSNEETEQQSVPADALNAQDVPKSGRRKTRKTAS